MSDPSRTRVRNRLYLVGLLPAVLMLLVSGRIALLLHEQSSGLFAFEGEEYAAAADGFARNQVLNPFEPWLAHFDEGAARHRDGDLESAVAAYEDALDEEVPADWDCRVRNNLALAHEGLGDAALEAGDRLAAEESWLTGREVLADCLPDDANAVDPADPTDPDTDGDGVVSAEEAAAAAEAAADTDGDGVVSAEEAAAAAEAEAAADTDNDGVVSPDEARAAAADADADRDGVVSAAESSTVIDHRLGDKLGRSATEAPDPADPTARDGTAAERQRRLEERNSRALEQRLRQEQRREEQADSQPDPGADPEKPPIPEW